MPGADVVVVGAGLSGLVSGLAAAESGATVAVLAKGFAGTHWGTGGLDIAAPAGAASPREGVAQLARVGGHPYAILSGDVAPALAWLQERLGAAGLAYEGDLDTPLRPVPTSIGGIRRAAVLPAAQAAGARAWQPGERLIVCGVAGFKDFWPDAIAASLRRPWLWAGAPGPESVVAVSAELPDLAGRHNLSAVELANRFDKPEWRAAAIDAIARAVDRAGNGPARVALPAVFGIKDHAAVFAELGRRLPYAAFEMPLVPPSVPGMRLYNALRASLIAAGGRVMIGELVSHVIRDGARVSVVAMEAAARTTDYRAGQVVLATGGIAGGGLVADHDGRLTDAVLDLPVEAPPPEQWLSEDAFDPAGHPLEAAGIRTDGELRPVGRGGSPILENVRVVGSLLPGRTMRQRCRDGVDFTSGWRAARLLTAVGASAGETRSVRP